MEAHAIGVEAEAMGMIENIDGELRSAAELPRQRPFGAVIGAKNAAEDESARSGTGDLLDLLAGVDGKKPDTARVGGRDVALLFDGVAVGDAVGRGAGSEGHVDLGDAGAVEGGAELGEEA